MSPKPPRIATLRTFPARVTEALAAFGSVSSPPDGLILRGDAAGRHLARADAVLVSPADPITAEMLALAPSLKFVSSVSAGLDHVDLAACDLAGVTVANAPDETTEPTADLAFGLILAAARRLPAADQFVRSGDWKLGTAPFWGLDVHHRTLGIIGMGRIGKAIARRAQGFSMAVLYHNRRQVEGGTAQWRSMDDLLAQSDFVVLQAPLTPDTRHMIGARELALMKPSGVLINTGRGGTIDEDALVDALEAGRIARAALDVFEGEPALNPRLLTCPNLILAPHIGTATQASRAAMADQAVANLGAMLRG